ncbi:MAG: L-threonine 3-dehydrogenase [Nanoarchaeota archaeon]|nr:L-threonine 3-dehydrogenase [Nanoarchaeota archaeon]
MKAIVKQNPSYGAEIQDIPTPKIDANEVLIKVKATSICGTDLHIYQWNQWAQNRIKPPIVFGHEFCGEVTEVGKNVSNINIKDYVSAETHITCGECYQCRNKEPQICNDLKIIGVDIPGCFAEYIAVPASRIWKNDKNLKPEHASIQEPFGNSIYALFADDKSIKGKNIAIFGCGPTGLFATAIAKASNAGLIISSDINPYRLDIAKNAGADHVLNPEEENVPKKIKELTGGVGADIVLEMTGNHQVFQSVLESSRRGGRITLFGLFNKKIEIDATDDIIFSGRKIIGITGRKIWQTWEKTAELLNSKKLNLDSIINHNFKFEEYEQGMKLMEEGNCGKIVLTL